MALRGTGRPRRTGCVIRRRLVCDNQLVGT